MSKAGSNKHGNANKSFKTEHRLFYLRLIDRNLNPKL